MLIWFLNVLKVSGSYLVNHIAIQLFGQTTHGAIKEVLPNLEIKINRNYLARVMYVGPNGETIETQLRYGAPEVKGINEVTILFKKSEPGQAILVEDAGYFISTVKGLMFFATFFGILWSFLFLFEWVLFKKTLKKS